jgi:hypothetical protein
MKKVIVLLCGLILFSLGSPVFHDGTMIEWKEQELPSGRQFLVIDSFPAGATNYSMGLACDGAYLWNDEAFLHWFARMDTATGAVINSFATAIGNRDMTFDGQYLWASDWQTSSISKFDTAACTVVNTYYPPFYAGKPNGMAWDGTHLWVGEESGRIYQMTLTGDTVRSIPPPVPYSYEPRGLAFDGSFLWVGYQSSGLIYKVDTTNGSILETFAAPGIIPGQRFQQGLACDGMYLWSTAGSAISGVTDMIYMIDIGLTGTQDLEKTMTGKPLLNVEGNPCRHAAVMHVKISEPGNVRLSVVDVIGRTVAVLENGFCTSGDHMYTWRTTGETSGIYYLILETIQSRETLKLILISN